jgi:hypothetical protein
MYCPNKETEKLKFAFELSRRGGVPLLEIETGGLWMG